jgi:hypothetical protein
MLRKSLGEAAGISVIADSWYGSALRPRLLEWTGRENDGSVRDAVLLSSELESLLGATSFPLCRFARPSDRDLTSCRLS